MYLRDEYMMKALQTLPSMNICNLFTFFIINCVKFCKYSNILSRDLISASSEQQIVYATIEISMSQLFRNVFVS